MKRFTFVKKLLLFMESVHSRSVVRALVTAACVFVAFYVAATSVQTVFNSYKSAESSGQTKRKLPIYCVDTPDKKVAISFDAAWGADSTDTLLKILEENDVKATFFLCGYWVDKYPEEVKRIAAAGHDIGNHGNTHAHGAQLSLQQNKDEIAGAHDKVKQLLNVDMNLFRPPFGEYNNTVVQAAEDLGYYTIQWDVDSHDWMNKGADYEINQVLNHKHLGPGSVILFHNDAKSTPQTLPIIIKGLKDKGYEIVPISELIHKDNFEMNHEGRQMSKDAG